jgi:hypothetical protein
MSVDRRGEELTPEPPVTSHGASNERLEIQAWDTEGDMEIVHEKVDY